MDGVRSPPAPLIKLVEVGRDDGGSGGSCGGRCELAVHSAASRSGAWWGSLFEEGGKGGKGDGRGSLGCGVWIIMPPWEKDVEDAPGGGKEACA